MLEMRIGTIKTPWFLALAVVVALVAIASFALVAVAEPPMAEQSSNDVAHHWTARSAGVAPYTELAPAEAAAIDTAKKALTQPPLGVIRNADHGYGAAQGALDTMKAVSTAAPIVAGHELVLSNGTKAVRVYVNQDGSVKPLGSGTLWVSATPNKALSDHNDFDAAEIARGALALHAALDPGTA
ncbi:MAG: hypothetical protein FDZ75_06060, partial [Actinobacteria bacterium]